MQLQLDFSKPRIDSGKKTERIPTAVSSELKEFVDKMAQMQGVSVSELVHRYVVEGLKNDVVNIFIPEPHMDKSLREILQKT